MNEHLICRPVKPENPIKPFGVLYATRVFLNAPHKTSPASIQCVIEEEEDRPVNKNIEYTIRIRDCNDGIKLHGSLSNQESFSNAIFKIDTLVKELTEMKKFIENEVLSLIIKPPRLETLPFPTIPIKPITTAASARISCNPNHQNQNTGTTSARIPIVHPTSLCPSCGAVEVESLTPRTVYQCGSSVYDHHPDSFIQSYQCKILTANNLQEETN